MFEMKSKKQLFYIIYYNNKLFFYLCNTITNIY